MGDDHFSRSFPLPGRRLVTARALLLGDRIEAAGLERSDMISSTPLAFHAGANGFVALYRFGVVVMVGLSPLEEDGVLKQVKLRVSDRMNILTTNPPFSKSRRSLTTRFHQAVPSP